MKKILQLLVFLVAITVYSQTGSIDNNQITGNDINDTSMQVQDFMLNEMRYSPKGERGFDHQSDTKVIVTTTYQNFTNPQEQLQLIYTTHPEANRLIVDGLTVKGDKNALINFFVRYWNTEIDIETIDAHTAHRDLLGDQVALYTTTEPRIEVNRK